MAPKTEQKIYVGIGLDFETGGLDCRESVSYTHLTLPTSDLV